VNADRIETPAPTVQCPSCKRAVAADVFLSACSDFWSEVDVVRFQCPLCHDTTDARLEPSRIWLGYIYAAGAPHFSGMIEVRVDGLLVERDGDDLLAELGDATWKIPAR
jgi:hypothetical protein